MGESMGGEVLKVGTGENTSLVNISAEGIILKVSKGVSLEEDKMLSDDRARVKKAFSEENLVSHLVEAIRAGKSKFNIYLGERSGTRNHEGSISPQVMSELKHALRNNSVLTDVSLRRDAHHYSNGQYLVVHFNNPNAEPVRKIPDRAADLLSQAMAAVKNAILAPFQPSPAKVERYRNQFVSDFKEATQDVINAAPAFNQAAKDKGLQSAINVDRIATLSTRYLELAEQRQNELSRLPFNEKLPLEVVKDLAKSMDRASKMHGLGQKDVSEIESTVAHFEEAMSKRIERFESSQRTVDQISLSVARIQLSKY